MDIAIASLALVLYIIMNIALIKFLPITLTASGIAGFILSIGMAVDANILIFERMKEELRGGKSAVIVTELPYGVKKGGDAGVIKKIVTVGAGRSTEGDDQELALLMDLDLSNGFDQRALDAVR